MGEVLSYDAKCWALKKDKRKLWTIKMRMLRMIANGRIFIPKLFVWLLSREIVKEIEIEPDTVYTTTVVIKKKTFNLIGQKKRSIKIEFANEKLRGCKRYRFVSKAQMKEQRPVTTILLLY